MALSKEIIKCTFSLITTIGVGAFLEYMRGNYERDKLLQEYGTTEINSALRTLYVYKNKVRSNLNKNLSSSNKRHALADRYNKLESDFKLINNENDIVSSETKKKKKRSL